jgi:hypothetical protein
MGDWGIGWMEEWVEIQNPEFKIPSKSKIPNPKR